MNPTIPVHPSPRCLCLRMEVAILVMLTLGLFSASWNGSLASALMVNLGAISFFKTLNASEPPALVVPFHWLIIQDSRRGVEDGLRRSAQYLELANGLHSPGGSTHRLLGFVAGKQGQLDRAAEQLTLALTIRPHDDMTRAGLVVLFSALNYEAQQQVIPILAQTRDRTIPISVLLAKQYRRLGDVNTAISTLQLALRLDPSSPQDQALIHRRLGELYLQQSSQTEEAVSHLRETVLLVPEDGHAHALLGEALLKEGNIGEATTELGLAVELQQTPYAWFQLGQAYLFGGSWSEAIQSYQQAILLDANNKWAFYGTGLAHYEMGELQRAYEAFQQAQSIDPGFAFASYGIGLVFCDWGKDADASRSWEQSLASDPTFTVARQALEQATADPCSVRKSIR